MKSQNFDSAGLADRANAKTSAAALDSFFKISEKWRCDPEEEGSLLGEVGIIRLESYRADRSQELEHSVLIRICMLVMIFKSTMQGKDTAAGSRQVIRRNNDDPPFFGNSPIQLIMLRQLEGLKAACLYFSGTLPRQLQ